MKILAAALCLALLATPAAAETVTGLPIAVDGDSLRFPGVEVRVHGIDAPEYDQQCTRAGQPYACGTEATAAMRALIAGRPVTCTGVLQPDGTERDMYGRLLGKCRAGDIELNAAMVEAGMARAFVRYSSDYVEHEARAKAAGRGIWAGEHMAPWDYRAAKRAKR